MSSGENSNSAGNRADLVPFSSVWPNSLDYDGAAYFFLHEGVKYHAHILSFLRKDFLTKSLNVGFVQLLSYGINSLLPLLLVRGSQGEFQSFGGEFPYPLLHLWLWLKQRYLHLWSSDFGADLFLESAEFLYVVMGKHDSAQSLLLSYFVGPGFHHHDRVFCASYG